LSDSEVQTAINNDADHGSTASHNYTTSASGLTDVSPDSDADAHHAVFEPADYNPVSDVEAHGNALAIDITGDADTLDGYEGSELAVRAEDETITGNYTFQGAGSVNSRLNVGVRSGANVTSASGWGSDDIFDDVPYDTATFGRRNAGHGLSAIRLVAQRSSGSTVGSRIAVLTNDVGTERLAIRFGTSAMTEAISVQSNGDVGINQTNPSYAIETAGDMRATGEVEAFLGSDRRLKTDLDPLNSALNKVDQLTGYGFDWHEGEAVQPHKRGMTDVGLIAQEVEDVLPEAVKTFTDGHSEGYKSVNYDKLVPLLVEAIKDLRSQVNQLQ
jgi:hypothetical protein